MLFNKPQRFDYYVWFCEKVGHDLYFLCKYLEIINQKAVQTAHVLMDLFTYAQHHCFDATNFLPIFLNHDIVKQIMHLLTFQHQYLSIY